MDKKFMYSEQTSYVNQETGEVIEQTTKKVYRSKIENPEHFIRMFAEHAAIFYGLKPDTAKIVLVWLSQNADWNTGKVLLTTSRREQLCKELQIKPQTLSNALCALKKQKCITGEKGEFIINPHLFWKGSDESKRELLQNKDLQITFEFVESETLDETFGEISNFS